MTSLSPVHTQEELDVSTAIYSMHPLIRKIFNMVHARILGPNHQLDQRVISPL